MMQSRVKAGKDMELFALKDGWVKQNSKPILKWRVPGKNNIEKIINSNYNPKNFSVLENVTLNKYDIYHPIIKKYREVKSYYVQQVNKWTLYSEPYFKIATRTQLSKISTSKYNEFVEKFYQHANNTGILNFIQTQMSSSNEGILFKDGFILTDKLEFRTILNKEQWGGYHRIQIEFRIKD
jgi:hypothetical protein